MRRFARWVAIVLGALVVLALGLAGGVWILSERILTRTYHAPLEEIAVDPAHAAEGQRLATLRGCNGCHEANLGGGVFVEDPGVVRLVAPNLTRVAAESTNAELARAIRRGVKRDGRGVFGMPSPMFSHLTDEDLGAILAYLRSAPRVDAPQPDSWVGPLARLGLVLGEFRHDTLDVPATRVAIDRGTPAGLGRYLALTCCSECHGPELRGDGTRSPDLAIVASYGEEEFRALMATGKARGARELKLMSAVARGRFRHFHPAEVSALYAYLSAARK